MDELTNKKIEKMKENPPNRVLPVLLLPLALAGVFCYRVASTDPQWEAGAKTMPAAPKNAASPAPKIQTAAPAVDVRPAEAPSPRTADEAPRVPVTPAIDASTPIEAPSAGGDALDTYLNSHLGQKVPFLYKGEKRTVTLAAFSDETVTIKRKKSFTMKRTDLSPEQLKLWR